MRLRRLLALVVAVLAASGALPARARAEEPPPPAGPSAPAPVADLTQEEVAALRRRLPWDVLDQVAKERIARNVARLRTMTPEERERVLERAHRLDRAGPLAKAQFGDRLRRLSRLSTDDVRRAREGRLFARAVGQTVLRALPEEAQAVVRALPESERSDVEACVVGVWRRAALDVLAARPPSALSLPPGTHEGLVQRFTADRESAVRAGDAAAPEPTRRRLARTVLDAHVFARLRGLFGARAEDGPRAEDAPRAGPRDRGALVERLSTELRADLPEAFDATTATVARAAAGGRDALLALCESERGGRFGSTRERGLADVFLTIERLRALLAEVSPDLAAQGEALQARVLAALGVAEADAKALAAARTPAEREAVLERIEALRRHRRGDRPPR